MFADQVANRGRGGKGQKGQGRAPPPWRKGHKGGKDSGRGKGDKARHKNNPRR